MAKTNKPKRRKAGAGRPTVMTPEVIAKLEEGLKLDFTIGEACAYAQIDQATYYRKCKSDKDFARRMESAQMFIFYAAKRNIGQSVINDKNVEDAKWLLKRRQKERYSERVDNNISGSINISQILDTLEDGQETPKP